MRKTKSRERIRILSLVVVLLLLPTMMFAIPESGKKVTLNLESVTVKDFFDALRQQIKGLEQNGCHASFYNCTVCNL